MRREQIRLKHESRWERGESMRKKKKIILAAVLAMFAVWLGFHLARQSYSAADSIQKLAGEDAVLQCGKLEKSVETRYDDEDIWVYRNILGDICVARIRRSGPFYKAMTVGNLPRERKDTDALIEIVEMARGQDRDYSIGIIRDDAVDTQQILTRERHPCIDDDDLILIFDGGHILPDLFKSAQRDDLDAVFCFLLRNDDFLLLHRFAGPILSFYHYKQFC